jgi:hypothetical protein
MLYELLEATRIRRMLWKEGGERGLVGPVGCSRAIGIAGEFAPRAFRMGVSFQSSITRKLFDFYGGNAVDRPDGPREGPRARGRDPGSRASFENHSLPGSVSVASSPLASKLVGPVGCSQAELYEEFAPRAFRMGLSFLSSIIQESLASQECFGCQFSAGFQIALRRFRTNTILLLSPSITSCPVRSDIIVLKEERGVSWCSTWLNQGLHVECLEGCHPRTSRGAWLFGCTQ